MYMGKFERDILFIIFTCDVQDEAEQLPNQKSYFII